MEDYLTLDLGDWVYFELTLPVILVVFKLSQVSQRNWNLCDLESAHPVFLSKLKFTIVNVSSCIHVNSVSMVLVLFEVPRIFLNQRAVFRLVLPAPLFYDQLTFTFLFVICEHALILVGLWAQSLQSIT